MSSVVVVDMVVVCRRHHCHVIVEAGAGESKYRRACNRTFKYISMSSAGGFFCADFLGADFLFAEAFFGSSSLLLCFFHGGLELRSDEASSTWASSPWVSTGAGGVRGEHGFGAGVLGAAICGPGVPGAAICGPGVPGAAMLGAGVLRAFARAPNGAICNDRENAAGVVILSCRVVVVPTSSLIH